MQTPQTDSINELTSTSIVLETRLKELNKARQMMYNITSYEEFKNFKLKIFQIFFDLDQEIRETLQNIKSAHLQNKEISNEKEFFFMKMNNLENKFLNSENYISELKQNNKELVNQINFQQEKMINDENLILSLQVKLLNYEEAIEPMQEKTNIPTNKHPNKINQNQNQNNIINNTNFISLQPRAQKFNLASVNKENAEFNKTKNNTITVRINKDKEETIKETNENFSNLNFNYNSSSTCKFENDYISNNINRAEQVREDRFYLNRNANESQNKNSIDIENVINYFLFL